MLSRLLCEWELCTRVIKNAAIFLSTKRNDSTPLALLLTKQGGRLPFNMNNAESKVQLSSVPRSVVWMKSAYLAYHLCSKCKTCCSNDITSHMLSYAQQGKNGSNSGYECQVKGIYAFKNCDRYFRSIRWMINWSTCYLSLDRSITLYIQIFTKQDIRDILVIHLSSCAVIICRATWHRHNR